MTVLVSEDKVVCGDTPVGYSNVTERAEQCSKKKYQIVIRKMRFIFFPLYTLFYVFNL